MEYRVQKTDNRKEENKMGFFDKKQCSVCGKDAGRLLAYALKDNKYLCDECSQKIYTGFNSPNAEFSLEHYRDHYLPYHEKTKKMRELFKTTCFYGGLYIDAEHRLFSISDCDYDNIMKKNDGRPSERMPVFEFSAVTMAVIRLDKVKVNQGGMLGPHAEGNIKLRLVYSDPVLDYEYSIASDKSLPVEKKGFISKTLTYGFPEKLLPVKDIFDELVIQAAKINGQGGVK